MSLPEVVSREQWLDARVSLLAQEKELTRHQTAVNTARRQLPMIRLDKKYTFEGPRGTVELADLFGGKRQLLLQHVMFGPDWEQPCPGCSAGIDATAAALIEQLRSRETHFVLVSRAPYRKLAEAQQERGWFLPWYSSFGSDFNYDFNVTLDKAAGQVAYNYRPEPQLLDDTDSTEMPGVSSFLRDGEDIFHTYSTYARGTEFLGSAYSLLDLTALGRQESWEEPNDRTAAERGGDPTFTS
jgi:predicted dithiol-disulfide oxidoreductase (DUF899 family)